ncbi:hypothetical protein Ahy_A06g029894 isoform B [Arachis hypogaea]|uniref:Uncharacterized protein n=1 Tax=Arachis hypogaea TaxID=3818 RepID=A0A445CUI7_ARAHY|nr:hypothetical protein Ahy_A06g029894 isoform B [Arachis hypogaea]
MYDNIRITVCLQDQICFFIGEIIDVLKHQKWWYYCCLCNASVCHVGNVLHQNYCFHSNGSNIFILEDDEVMQILKKSCSVFLIDERNSSKSMDDYTIQNSMISQLMNKKIVFIVDPRPIGYELNTSLHFVRAICDDINIVKFLEDSTHDNQQQLTMIFMQEFCSHKVPIYLGIISLSLLGKSFAVPLDNVKILSRLLKGWMSVVANHQLHYNIYRYL